jgi:(p)ppGpp synthase/HD superfamily hydrolase
MPLSSKFSEALTYACLIHRDQRRKASDVPYVAHLLAVASLAIEAGATEAEAIAALLHDAIEDQKIPKEELAKLFGSEVSEIVDGCTDAHTHPKPPWRERKDQHLAHLAHASKSVVLVTTCDKLHNARAVLSDYRALGEAVWSRFNGGREGTLWYYRSVSNVLSSRGKTPLTEELERVVAELESLARSSAEPAGDLVHHLER